MILGPLRGRLVTTLTLHVLPFKSCLVLGGHDLGVHNCGLPTSVLQHQGESDRRKLYYSDLIETSYL